MKSTLAPAQKKPALGLITTGLATNPPDLGIHSPPVPGVGVELTVGDDIDESDPDDIVGVTSEDDRLGSCSCRRDLGNDIVYDRSDREAVNAGNEKDHRSRHPRLGRVQMLGYAHGTDDAARQPRSERGDIHEEDEDDHHAPEQ